MSYCEVLPNHLLPLKTRATGTVLLPLQGGSSAGATENASGGLRGAGGCARGHARGHVLESVKGHVLEGAKEHASATAIWSALQ